MPVIRPILPFETAELRAHFLRLTAEERYLRFAGPAPEAVVDRYVQSLGWARAVRLGCFLEGRLRAVAELVLVGEGAAELAVTVEGAWQHHGLASELVSRILVIARNRGIRRIVAHCLAENQHMRALLRKFHGELACDGANAEAHIATGVPTPLSYWQECVHTADGLVGFLAQQWLDRPAAWLPQG
jgi:RimJ/RimL family protein N-acetyltransferase